VNSPLQETRLGQDLRRLMSDQPFTPDLAVIAERARQRRRRGLALRGVTAAAAVVLAAGGVFVGVHGTGSTGSGVAAGRNPAASGKPSATRTTTSPTSTRKPVAAVNPILAQLAAEIKVKQVTLPGDATLEIRNQSPTSDEPGDNGVDLYTNSGIYYYADSMADLPAAIASGVDTGQGGFVRAIAAAVYAVNGDITTARARMAIANLIPGVKPVPMKEVIAQLKAMDKERGVKYEAPKALTPAQKAEQTDNFIWMNSLFALEAAPENPQVRAGVLNIMATMPNVKVTSSTTAGEPTLTVADSWPLLTDGGLVESLVINASTGLPIALFNTDPGQPLNQTYFHASRVTLANIEAGKY
jgi:hypothetical protein